jgi:hypothetical protein
MANSEDASSIAAPHHFDELKGIRRIPRAPHNQNRINTTVIKSLPHALRTKNPKAMTRPHSTASTNRTAISQRLKVLRFILPPVTQLFQAQLAHPAVRQTPQYESLPHAQTNLAVGELDERGGAPAALQAIGLVLNCVLSGRNKHLKSAETYWSLEDLVEIESYMASNGNRKKNQSHDPPSPTTMSKEKTHSAINPPNHSAGDVHDASEATKWR